MADEIPASGAKGRAAARAILHGDGPIESVSEYLTDAWHRLGLFIEKHQGEFDEDDTDFLDGLFLVVSNLSIAACEADKRAAHTLQFRRRRAPLSAEALDKERRLAAAWQRMSELILEDGKQKSQAKALAAEESQVSVRDLERHIASWRARLGRARPRGRPKKRGKSAPEVAN